MGTMDPSSTLGILNPAAGLGRFWLDRLPPPEDLEDVVERFWMVRWDFAPGETFTQEILPHPAVNLSFERSTHDARDAGRHGLRAHGISTRRFAADLEGRGIVLGTKLTPAGFYPFARIPLGMLFDRVVPLEEVMGATPEFSDVEALPPPEAFRSASAKVSAFLRERLAGVAIDPIVRRVNALVARVREDREILLVEDLAREDGSSVRQLQRAFRRVVGVGPKWVVQRTRVQDAAERVARGERLDWARTAQDLGYHDQAHLIRDFRAQVGFTPEAYARRCREAVRDQQREPARAG